MRVLKVKGMISTLALVLVAQAAFAQAAPEHHAWQDRRTFEPYSRTSERITGPVSVSGKDNFTEKGSTMMLTFGNGKSVKLISEGAFYGYLSDGSEKVTAEVFRIERDPGELEAGNYLCGASEPARFVAMSESYSVGYVSHLLQLAVFQSKARPKSIDSPGLCGTFNYLID